MFVNVFSNTVSQICTVQHFLLVNLVSTLSQGSHRRDPVLEAATFPPEAMDWFERFPRSLLWGVFLCYLILEEGVFSESARNNFFNRVLGTPRPWLTLPAWLRALSTISECTSWGEYYTDACILYLQRLNVSQICQLPLASTVALKRWWGKLMKAYLSKRIS